MSIISKIESILFVASKPLSIKQIAKTISVKEIDVREALETLKMKYNQDNSGIRILFSEELIQMSTAPENVEYVDLFIKDEVSGELTKAQLETLTVIAYRGPITRSELEQIRGVNCSLIIRNLLVRGLIEEKEEENKILPLYFVSLEALRHLGIDSVENLPDYEIIHKHEYIENILNNKENDQ